MPEDKKSQTVQRLADTPEGPVFLAAYEGGKKGGMIGGVIGAVIALIVCLICHYVLN